MKNKKKVINFKNAVDVKSFKNKQFGRSHSKAEKLKFLNGSGNLTSLNAPEEERLHSMYYDTYQGKPSPDRGNNISHYFTVSSATGSCIPETKMLTFYSSRFEKLNSSFCKISQNKKLTESWLANKVIKENANSSERNIYSRRNVSIDYKNA